MNSFEIALFSGTYLINVMVIPIMTVLAGILYWKVRSGACLTMLIGFLVVLLGKISVLVLAFVPEVPAMPTEAGPVSLSLYVDRLLGSLGLLILLSGFTGYVLRLRRNAV